MCDNFFDKMFDFNGDGVVSDFEKDTGYIMYSDMVNDELNNNDSDSGISDFDCCEDF